MVVSGATYPAYTCDLCGLTNLRSGETDEGPLHSTVYACQECGHWHCPSHHLSCGLCFACCAEQHGLDKGH